MILRMLGLALLVLVQIMMLGLLVLPGMLVMMMLLLLIMVVPPTADSYGSNAPSAYGNAGFTGAAGNNVCSTGNTWAAGDADDAGNSAPSTDPGTDAGSTDAPENPFAARSWLNCFWFN
uniref:Uncharacterized protein n=1 Tax=Picea glauca TaxID=3330 RepID=A0A101M3C6_PICGL|nr:hypothetical protein ABT39_MTgene46 [Picea glauca]QHR86187.1 hypothetical protein Q903MT_gene186 [Picea sitchensis]